MDLKPGSQGRLDPGRRPFPRHAPIAVVLVFALLAGFFLVPHYGQSWDEPGNYRYGVHSLQNYYNLFHGLSVTDFNELNLDQKGPFFFILGEFLANIFTAIIPRWTYINGWHFSIFLTYLLGVAGFYTLVGRWLRPWATLTATLLFMLQPLFWGHAFINLKDIPFMAFFLASVSAGFWMVDWLKKSGKLPELFTAPIHEMQLLVEWNHTKPWRKVFTILLTGGWLGLTLLVFYQQTSVQNILANVIDTIYSADPTSTLGRLFSAAAPNASNVAVESYIAKAQATFFKAEIAAFTFVSLAVFLIAFRLALPQTYHMLAESLIKPGGKGIVNAWRYPPVWAAGIILGMTSSIRLTGPYAGILVVFYGLYRNGRRFIPAAISYGLIGITTMYMTWPYLWRDPIGRFITSMGVMAEYSTEIVKAPRYLIIILYSIQLTEPVIFLFLMGIIFLFFEKNFKKYRDPLLLTLAWLILPVSLVIVSSNELYDNFRHLYFLLPPVFIMAGVALDVIFARVSQTWGRFLLIMIFLLPGVLAIFNLHPYEYIYYNNLVGGVKGAFRNYELDYWATSYKEATEYINKIAPENSSVGVVGTDLLVRAYARPDLEISNYDGLSHDRIFDYVIVTTRANNDLAVCPAAPIIKTIERQGAVLTVIKHPDQTLDGCK